MTFHRSPLAQNLLALCFAAPLFVSARASAAEACGDEICPKGYQCETFDAGCPAIACADDSDCAPCEPSVTHVCVAQPCSSDADCAADMVCFTDTHEECEDTAGCATPDSQDDGGADEKVPNCEPAEPPVCTTVSTSACIPRWQLPCQLASDCGAGFTCEEQMRGGCSGSSGSAGGGSTPSDPATPPDGDAGGAEPAPDEGFAPTPPDGGADDGGDCFFEPSGVSACVAIEVACATDADCAEGWTCENNNEGACWASSDGSSGCDPVDPAKVCAPPYAHLGGGRGVGEDDSGASNGGGEPTAGGGEPEVPPTPPKGEGDSASGDHDAASGDSDESVESGCSVSHVRGGSTGLGFLALALGALFGARRRRAR